jgi:hypothetical protein
MSKLTKITKKRFVISKSLIGKNLLISFTNKKGEKFEYDHDAVFSVNQERLLSMSCFNEYGNYTNTNKIPNWAK